jgi:hypothetical protein
VDAKLVRAVIEVESISAERPIAEGRHGFDAADAGDARHTR